MNKEEMLHIIVSVVTISLAFSFIQPSGFTPAVFMAILFTLGLGFILHELAHKYVAIHFGVHAEYRAWTAGLFMALVLALTVGFVFAAPGAVYIMGRVSREQTGKIAVAGPLMNLFLALVFVGVGWLVPAAAEFAALGAFVNLFLGAFNMLPIFVLDGQKVAAWNQGVWAALFLAFVALLFLPVF